MSSVSGSGERILAILDLFTEERLEWTPEEMMETLGYSRPTLYRYLKTLKDAGFLVSLPGAGFTLGPRVTEMDFLMRRSDPLIAAGAPRLATLATRHPCAALLVRWYGRKLLCVAAEVSAPGLRSSYPRGRPMPIGRGAISRAIVAFLPKRRQEELVRDYLGEFAATGAGTTVEEVLEALRGVRRDGVAVAHGEVTPGVVGVAAPVLVDGHIPVAALCMTSAEADVPDEGTRATLAREVRAFAAEISDALARTEFPEAPQRATA